MLVAKDGGPRGHHQRLESFEPWQLLGVTFNSSRQESHGLVPLALLGCSLEVWGDGSIQAKVAGPAGQSESCPSGAVCMRGLWSEYPQLNSADAPHPGHMPLPSLGNTPLFILLFLLILLSTLED